MQFEPALDADGGVKRSGDQKKLRILVLEDNPADADLVIRKLKVSGFQFHADLVASSRQFMEAANSITYDIILADYRIPGWSGLEALRWLRSSRDITPFVLVTGTLGDELAIECIKAGASDYVLKENLERLPVAVRRALEAAELRRQRDRVEREKREAEEQYRVLFDSNPEPMWVFDRKTLAFLAVNEAAIRHYGYTREEFARMTILDIRPAEDVPDVLRSSLQNPTRGLQNSGTWRHRVKGGRIIDVQIGAHDLKFNGRDAELILINDVTETKNSLQQLQQSEERFSKVFRSSPLAITIASKEDGRYIDVNDAFLKMLELQREQVIGHTSRELNIWYDPMSSGAMIRELERATQVTAFETELQTASGKRRLVRIAADLIHLNGVPCLLSIISDITESRSMEEQFRQAQKMEAVGELAGGMAHDFNNMLSIILGYSDLALEEVTPESSAGHRIRQIKNVSQRAAGLTRRLLAFSRQQVLQPVLLNLDSILTSVRDMLCQVISENISLTIKPNPELEMVKADRGQLEQVLLNLVLNARDAMPNGGEIVIETANVRLDALTAKVHPACSPGDYVMLSVSDTGCGMDRETLPRIFEPFYTTKPPGKGTGLGLSMVYGVIRQSGGDILVYSEPGKGATFKIYLPSVKEKLERPGPTLAPPSYSRGSETVVLVEDDPELRSLTAELLENEGYRVLVAENGEAANELLSREQPKVDLLLTDVILPGMSGPELVRTLQARQPDLKVLYISGYTGAQIARHGVLEGAEFVEKPFTKESLLAHIRKMLGTMAES
jgi:two-component system cell cycle sensor histidine kinase/response regulator CckA